MVLAGKDACKKIVDAGAEVVFCCNDIMARGTCCY